jgi:hypothetical protein
LKGWTLVIIIRVQKCKSLVDVQGSVLVSMKKSLPNQL